MKRGESIKRALLMLLALSVPVHGGTAGEGGGEEGSEEAPSRDITIKINSREFVLLKGELKGIFKGDVRVAYGVLEITCDEMEVLYNPETNAVERVVGKGNVRIMSGGKRGEGEEVHFFVSEERVVLLGKPVLEDGVNRMEGERVEFSVSEERVDCFRCKVSISPEAIRGLDRVKGGE